MSGEDEDRLDFGEDEELEDQISLGDAEDAAAGWSAGQQQEGVASNGHAQSSKGDDTSRGGADSIGNQTAVQDSNDGEEPLPPGWVTRTSRQGELYYFHEPTTLSQWDRPTASSASVTEDAEPASTDAKSGASVPVASAAVQAATTAAADSSSHDTSTATKSGTEVKSDTPTGPAWGRRNQQLQDQAFNARSSGKDGSERPRSAREVAAASAAKQSATSSGTSSSDKAITGAPLTSDRTCPLPSSSGTSRAAAVRGSNDSASVDTSARASPAIPTGPRSAKPLPTGPRSQQQLDGNRWPARDTQQRQSSTSALPTGPSADRTRQRDAAQPSGRPSGRDASSLPSGPKQTRGDSGWPTREPVGPPADLDRASSSGFRGPPPTREFPASRGREFDYDDRRYPRSDRSAGNREPEASYREAPPLRESRGPPRELRDEGWSRRPAPQESYATDRERMPPRREPSPPPRRPRSPPPARRDLPLGPDRRPRSPLPARPARERLDQDYRPQPREYASDSERNARRPARRSPSPPPMRKWAVKAVTPPQQEEGAPSAVDDRSENTAAAPSNNKATTNNERASGPDTKVDIETSETAFKTETPSVQQQAEPSSTAEAKAEEKDIVVFPRPREKRVISPGLASRLDQPLSQPPPRDTRRRGGRPSPPPSSRPFRRSPSPDPQRRRLGAPSGSTLADRMGDGPRSLLSRMGDGGDRIEDRPAKRSRQEGRNGSSAMDMDVDSPADLSDRLRGPRPRSQSPPPSGRGISIFGASKTQSNADGEGDVSRSLHVERVKLHDNGNGTSPLLRIADAESDSSSRYRDRAQVSQERSPGPSRADQAVPAESTQKSISAAQSNGLPPRPTGFASLPPKPSVIVPPPDMRGPPRREPSSSNTVLLDSYRPGQPDRRPSSRGPPVSKEPPELDRYVPRRLPPSGRGPRPRSRSPPPMRDYPRRDYR